MKIVINRCYGGFGLSEEAYKFLGLEWDGYGYLVGTKYRDENTRVNRANPDIVACVECLGECANGAHAELKVVEIPDDVEWEIEEYDGVEWVSEKHRTWW